MCHPGTVGSLHIYRWGYIYMHNNQVRPPLVGTRIFIMTSENALDSAAESRQAVARSMSTSPARIVSSNSERPLRLMPPTCSKCLSDPSVVRRRLVLLLPDIGAELACSITHGWLRVRHNGCPPLLGRQSSHPL